jgi:ankyrin repeat protein
MKNFKKSFFLALALCGSLITPHASYGMGTLYEDLDQKGVIRFATQSFMEKLWKRAVIHKNLFMIKTLLVCGVNPTSELLDIQNREGQTALIVAARYDRIDVVDLLIKAGANLDIQNHEGQTALIVAAVYGHIDVVDLLIKAGANLDSGKDTALSMATFHYHISRRGCYLDIARLLITANANLDIPNFHGYTALSIAVLCNRTNIINLLVEAGANPNIKDNSGKTVLMQLLDNDNVFRLPRDDDATIATAKLIAKKIHQEYRDDITELETDWYNAPLEVLATIVTPLAGNNPLDIQDNDGHTVLYYAALKNHFSKLVRFLISLGANPDIEDNQGHTVAYLVQHNQSLAPVQKTNLLAALLKKLPLPTNPERFCNICQEHDGGEYVLFEPCGHYFHANCARNYLEVSQQCPICHQPVVFSEQTFTIKNPQEERKES